MEGDSRGHSVGGGCLVNTLDEVLGGTNCKVSRVAGLVCGSRAPTSLEGRPSNLQGPRIGGLHGTLTLLRDNLVPGKMGYHARIRLLGGARPLDLERVNPEVGTTCSVEVPPAGPFSGRAGAFAVPGQGSSAEHWPCLYLALFA